MHPSTPTRSARQPIQCSPGSEGSTLHTSGQTAATDRTTGRTASNHSDTSHTSGAFTTVPLSALQLGTVGDVIEKIPPAAVNPEHVKTLADIRASKKTSCTQGFITVIAGLLNLPLSAGGAAIILKISCQLISQKDTSITTTYEENPNSFYPSLIPTAIAASTLTIGLTPTLANALLNIARKSIGHTAIGVTATLLLTGSNSFSIPYSTAIVINKSLNETISNWLTNLTLYNHQLSYCAIGLGAGGILAPTLTDLADERIELLTELSTPPKTVDSINPLNQLEGGKEDQIRNQAISAFTKLFIQWLHIASEEIRQGKEKNLLDLIESTAKEKHLEKMLDHLSKYFKGKTVPKQRTYIARRIAFVTSTATAAASGLAPFLTTLNQDDSPEAFNITTATLTAIAYLTIGTLLLYKLSRFIEKLLKAPGSNVLMLIPMLFTAAIFSTVTYFFTAATPSALKIVSSTGNGLIGAGLASNFKENCARIKGQDSTINRLYKLLKIIAEKLNDEPAPTATEEDEDANEKPKYCFNNARLFRLYEKTKKGTIDLSEYNRGTTLEF
jgi:hypothetical protein